MKILNESIRRAEAVQSVNSPTLRRMQQDAYSLRQEHITWYLLYMLLEDRYEYETQDIGMPLAALTAQQLVEQLLIENHELRRHNVHCCYCCGYDLSYSACVNMAARSV